MKTFLRENALSLVLFGLFMTTLIGLCLAGVRQHNEIQTVHNEPPVSLAEYVQTGAFIEAVFENWESEFLQMGAFVLLTIWFKQKGSKDSKKLRGNEPSDAPARYSIIHAGWRDKPKALGEAIYANSLTLALFGLFLLSLALHAAGGLAAYNADALAHHETPVSMIQYMGSSRFWFESFQNWQSEFLAVGVLIVFTIFLRQRHSPESKRIGEPDTATGSST